MLKHRQYPARSLLLLAQPVLPEDSTQRVELAAQVRLALFFLLLEVQAGLLEVQVEVQVQMEGHLQ
jgi:hypothetical protein